MNLLKKICLFSALLMVTGCGTILHISHLNGLYYQGVKADYGAIKNAFESSERAFVRGPVVIPWIICWAVDLPISLLTDTVLVPFDYIQGHRKCCYIVVVDEQGTRVSNANIQTGCGGVIIRGKTDKNGQYRLTADPSYVAWSESSKSGYYPAERSWQEPSLALELKARNTNAVYFLMERVIKPVPMIAKVIQNYDKEARIPKINQPYGFDVEKGDWVAPLGTGSNSDLVFRVDGTWNDDRNYDCVLTISFSHDEDGVAFVPVLPCGFRPFPRHAPLSDYQPTVKWRKSSKQGGAYLVQDTVTNECKQTIPFMFRVRSSSIKTNGVVENAYYGKLRDIDYRVEPSGVALKFIYYVNPVPNDRNLEFNPKKNLLLLGHEYENGVPAP